jgi:predicted DNA-binding transcriptional regulator AlpA
MNQARKLVNDEEAACYLGMSTGWIRMSRCNGNPDAPPFVKLGRSVRYCIADLDAWLEGKKQTNTLQTRGGIM